MQETSLKGNKLLSAPELLTELFAPESMPSIRWLRLQQKRRTIPFVRCGRLVFFDPVEVRQHLANNFTVEARQ